VSSSSSSSTFYTLVGSSFDVGIYHI
jgi:hypothetical protein